MSIQTVRKSVLGAIAAAAILIGGVWTGRIAAGPLAHGGHFSADKIFARIADRLDLSETQRDQVRDVLKSHRDAILGQIQAVRSARLALHQAINADVVDEAAIRQKASDLGKAEADAAVLHAQIRAEILPVLNDEQRQKLAAFHSHLEGKGDHLIGSIQQFLSK
jgi:Spy/CpxP family protein refolding chaperone